MLAEVIATVHQLAIACKKYKGIVFTDKHSNTIHEDKNIGSGDNADADDFTGVDTTKGVDDVDDQDDNDVTREIEQIQINDTTGVDDDEEHIEQIKINDTTGVDEEEQIEEQMHHDTTGVTRTTTEVDDNLGEYDDDNYVTIDSLNIIEQMNTAQINTNPETGDTDMDCVRHTVTNHG